MKRKTISFILFILLFVDIFSENTNKTVIESNKESLQRIFKIQNIIRIVVSIILFILFTSDLYNSFEEQGLYTQIYIGNNHFWQFDSIFRLKLFRLFECIVALSYLIFILICLLKQKYSVILFLYLLTLDVIAISYFVFLYFYNIANI